MKRIAPLGVLSFVVLAGCGAVCQNVATSFSQSLPDAPSAVQAAKHNQNLNMFVEATRSPVTIGAMGGHADVTREDEFAPSDKSLFSQNESRALFDKYLYPSALNQKPGGDHSSSNSNESLMGRATYAASRIIVTRDDSGKVRLNTPYFLRTLTLVAASTASRPYYRRSVGQPFGDFGSTVGNDAGMNLWHEFGPGIQQVMKSHTPKFVSRIEDRVGHN
jgi:hypothetical protein